MLDSNVLLRHGCVTVSYASLLAYYLNLSCYDSLMPFKTQSVPKGAVCYLSSLHFFPSYNNKYSGSNLGWLRNSWCRKCCLVGWLLG